MIKTRLSEPTTDNRERMLKKMDKLSRKLQPEKVDPMLNNAIYELESKFYDMVTQGRKENVNK